MELESGRARACGYLIPLQRMEEWEMRYATFLYAFILVCGSVFATGCAGTYSNLVSGSNLGAAEYQPAVHVPPEAKSDYQKVLAICRQAAKNRQITSAQRAQLGTITGVTEGTLQGASSGLQMGNFFKQAGFDGASRTEGALAGAAGGLISSLGEAVSSGTESNAAETRRILLNCLRSQADKVGYTVLE